ncbi:MAG: diacylglycerol kinase [Gammaproteobacteria bacterium]|nr:diacylglycerol kinase [Gammaproteobacteria bacterium]MDH5652486.1 diacylglycerol kinase [Gammaproteobacteria bacterium]
MKPGKTGLARIIAATGYSWQGLVAAVKHESAFRQELILGILLTPAAIWLGRSAVEYALLIGALFLVLIVELLNSAIEAVVDRAGDEYHELAGRAKDMGSAAVMLGLFNVALIWGLIAWDRFA